MKTVVVALLCFLIFVPAHAQQSLTIKLYFPNSKRDQGDCSAKVYPVTRSVPKTNGVARAALDQLFAGPTEQEKAKGFYSDFSEATKTLLLGVNIKSRNAYVNLRDLTTVPGMGNFTTSCGGSNFFGQVESTLKQFSSIKKVFFAVEGDPSFFYDWMQIGECPKELRNCDAANFVKSN
jgi:spore germination protein GerM